MYVPRLVKALLSFRPRAAAMSSSTIEAGAWFVGVTGCSESAWLEDPSPGITEASPVDGDPSLGPHLVLNNRVDGSTWDAGAFRAWSIEELNARCGATGADRSPAPSNAECPIEIHVHTSPACVQWVEVSCLQAAADATGAMFQVASNFNACENASQTTRLDSGSLVTRLMSDATQGPAAAAGAGAAAVTRTHAAFYSTHTQRSEWGQTRERQVELLGAESLRPHFPVCGGKAFCQPSETPWLSDEEAQRLLPEVRIGLHAGVKAVFSRVPQRRGWIRVNREGPTIDQVFVAALNMNAYGISSMPEDEVTSKRRFLLQAAYDGTYAAACMRGSTMLCLTLVGGGCFDNPIEDIVLAITRAHCKYCALPSCRIQRVVLPIFDKRIESASLLHLFESQGVHPTLVSHDSDAQEMDAGLNWCAIS